MSIQDALKEAQDRPFEGSLVDLAIKKAYPYVKPGAEFINENVIQPAYEYGIAPLLGTETAKGIGRGYDEVVKKYGELANTPGIFGSSLLSLLTPNIIPTMDAVENTAPGMAGAPKRAELMVQAAGEFIYGDAKTGLDKLNNGKDFYNDLTSAERIGIRVLPFDTIPLFGTIRKTLMKSSDEIAKYFNNIDDINLKTDIEKVKVDFDRSMGAAQTPKNELDKYNPIKTNREQIDESIDKLSGKKSITNFAKDFNEFASLPDFNRKKSRYLNRLKNSYGDQYESLLNKSSEKGLIQTLRPLDASLKNIADKLNNIDINKLDSSKPDEIFKLINTERSNVGISELTVPAGKTPDSSVVVKKLFDRGLIDEDKFNSIKQYQNQRYEIGQEKAVKSAAENKLTKKQEQSNLALDLVNQLKGDRTDFVIDSTTLHNRLKEKYPDMFTRTSSLNDVDFINQLSELNPEIKKSMPTMGQRVNPETFTLKRDTPGQEEIFANLYTEKFRPDEDAIQLLIKDPEMRFYNNLRRSIDQSAEDFFQNVNRADIEEGGKFHTDYLKFKKIDETRLAANESLKPILRKIFDSLRSDTARDRALAGEGVDFFGTKSSLQLAHKFKLSGVTEGFAADKLGKGAKAEELYIDISDYNSYLQNGLENIARKNYNLFQQTQDPKYKAIFNAIDEDMKIMGIEGQVAPNVKIGEAMDFDTKLSGLMINAMDKGLLTQTEVDKAITAANKIAKAKKDYQKMFKEPADFNKGGIVDAADVQYAAPGGFFSKMFGKPPAYMKEEIAKTDIFSPTTKQQATLTALGPEATAINPGQVFYSNIELSLSKPNSPVKFDSEKEFYDYINAAGIGRDEVGDARIGPYISAKAKSGEPILSQDIIQITSESPLNQLTTDGYGFRSDKINVAKRDQPQGYDSPAITKGQAVYREPKYSGTGLMPGYLPGTYRERVLQIDSDKFRGDPGTLPSASAQSHSFGDNYTIAWGRATDRPAIVNEGEMVDKATGTIINPLALTDTKKLQDIEAKIQTLVDDPLTKVDPDDFQTISQAVEALVQKSGGRLTYDKAKQAVDAQIVQKQKQLRKLQSQFVDEEKRLESISTMKPQDITMTFIDEIQSDIAQAATRKSKELAAKLDVMAEQGISFEAMQEGIDRDVLQFFAENKSVARPVGATKLELMPQYEELMAFQKQFSDMGKKRPYELTTQDFAMYDNFKKRQGEIIDSMADEINNQLMKALYPDVPLKDRGSWSDAVLKQQLYEAAHRLFIEKDPKAPTHLGVASGDIVAGKAYRQQGSTATDIAERTADKQRRLNNYKDALRSDINTPQNIGNSSLPGVGTHEFYGGPLSRAWDEEAGKVGGHYTSDIERSMRKYAEDNNSKLIIANVAIGESSSSKVYNIINQTTGDVVGQGDTYRQAEAIANDLVDNVGGRYEIKKGTDKNFETEPVFSIPLTKEMLQLNKIYK